MEILFMNFLVLHKLSQCASGMNFAFVCPMGWQVFHNFYEQGEFFRGVFTHESDLKAICDFMHCSKKILGFFCVLRGERDEVIKKILRRQKFLKYYEKISEYFY